MLSRKSFIGPAILLAAVLIGYPAFWLYAAAIGEDVVRDWIDEQRRNGFVVNHGRIEQTGFPLLVRVDISAPEAANSAKGLSWSSEQLRLDMRPWDLRRLRIEATGTQHFRLISKSDALDLTANTNGIHGVALIGDAGTVAALSLELREVGVREARLGDLFKTDRILADFESPQHPPISHTESALDVSLAAEDITLATLEAPLLGNKIANIRMKAEILGPIQGITLPGALSEWRDAGGTLEVRWMNFEWGALDLRANGTLALDRGMRPLGALTADIRGYEETLEALAEAKILRRDILPASRVTLNLLAKTDASDGRRVLTVPVTAQDGALFLGPIKLADLPAMITPALGRPSARQE